MRNRKHTRGLSLLLCAALLMGQLGTAASAAEPLESESTGGLCEHHPEHIDCGYVEGDEAHPCGYICEICNPKDSGGTEEQNDPTEETGPAVITVTDFDELDPAVRFQTVSPGTPLDELNLPAALGATGYTVTDDTQLVPEPITIENVTWAPDTAYDDTAEQGSYLFTPALPDGYTSAAEVELPEISVRIGAAANTLGSNPADANNDGYHDGDVAAINAMIDANDLPLSKDNPAGWAAGGVTWDESSTPKRITDLKLSEKGLTGEMDVSALTALTGLMCDGNQLTALNVTGLTALKELNCCKNSLKTLDVSSLTAMTGLRCERNKLATLTLSNQLTKLVYLDCSYNGLTALDVSGVTGLSYLDCSVNWLTELNVSSVTELDTLGCSNNRLTALDVSSLTELMTLDCSNNKLTALDASKLTKMKDLHCAFNDLNSLSGLSGLTNLTNLMCAYNPRLQSWRGWAA